MLEMGTFITGPAAGMLLADMGADVIKVEQPGTGDPFRSFKGELYSPHFQTYNRNKRSITIDPKNPDDLAILDQLVATADVFIQNFRPGVADRLKVDAARLQAINPALYAKMPFDPNKDLTPITALVSLNNVLVLHPSVKANNVKELVALAQSKPGQLNYGSGGNGTMNHLVGQLLVRETGVQFTHIPYRGSAPAMNASSSSSTVSKRGLSRRKSRLRPVTS